MGFWKRYFPTNLIKANSYIRDLIGSIGNWTFQNSCNLTHSTLMSACLAHDVWYQIIPWEIRNERFVWVCKACSQLVEKEFWIIFILCFSFVGLLWPHQCTSPILKMNLGKQSEQGSQLGWDGALLVLLSVPPSSQLSICLSVHLSVNPSSHLSIPFDQEQDTVS